VREGTPTGFVFYAAGRRRAPRARRALRSDLSDGDPEEMPLDLEHFLRLLRPGGLLISANLFLAQFVPDLASVDQMAEYRQRLLDDGRLLTAMVPGGLALSVARPDPDKIK
jgi:hypothetical protein